MRFVLLFICFFPGVVGRVMAQPDDALDLFRPKMPQKTDTLFYPFYSGQQLIEVDHIGYWDRKIFFLEQSQPRAMPHSIKHPMPLGNEYFVRDSSGVILKAFNSSKSTEELTAHFRSVPKKKVSALLFGMPLTHASRKLAASGMWPYSPQPSFWFNGYYKVSNKDALWSEYITQATQTDTRFGLIDTLGNMRLPLNYQQILPLNNELIVQQNGKWGIIDVAAKNIVPMRYDRFDNYYSDPIHNSILFFQSGEKVKAIYHVKAKKLYETAGYDRIHTIYQEQGYLLVENGHLYGLIDLQGKEILAPIYDRIHNLNAKDCGTKKCAEVVKDGKTFSLKLKE